MQMRNVEKSTRRWYRQIAVAFLGLGITLSAFAAQAASLPVANDSPLAGINFGDKPYLLPLQRDFQMAMLVAGSELGRSCGKMEAYGWRMKSSEQNRVNQIFNDTVDSMRAQGFTVDAKAPKSVARDVTLFTADRGEKHMLFMWSAGDIGLVMVLCQTAAPLSAVQNPSSSEVLSPTTKEQYIETGKALRDITASKQAVSAVKPRVFSPVGHWVGSYSCAQGQTGGTLSITHEHNGEFVGTFRFYPTLKSTSAEFGSYKVSGDYDSHAQRILINPGKWIQKPKGYSTTIMIGSFDPQAETFSGTFQGIRDCTSFEARYVADGGTVADELAPTVKKVAKKAKRKVVQAVKKQDVKPAANDVKTGDTETRPTPKTEGATTTSVSSTSAAPVVAPETPAAQAVPVVPPTSAALEAATSPQPVPSAPAKIDSSDPFVVAPSSPSLVEPVKVPAPASSPTPTTPVTDPVPAH